MATSAANQHALSRLAQLLRRRHRHDSGREFVVLCVEGFDPHANSDDLATQQIPVLRDAR